MNPIPSVGVLIIRDNKVLLVREDEGSSHVTGVYGVPGGRLEENEASIDAAKRELQEETGLICETHDLTEMPEKYIGTMGRKDGTTKTFEDTVFFCKKYEGEARKGEDTTPEWINISDLGNYNLLPNVEKMVTDGLKFASS